VVAEFSGAVSLLSGAAAFAGAVAGLCGFFEGG